MSPSWEKLLSWFHHVTKNDDDDDDDDDAYNDGGNDNDGHWRMLSSRIFSAVKSLDTPCCLIDTDIMYLHCTIFIVVIQDL
jgi:hypothetical protein